MKATLCFFLLATVSTGAFAQGVKLLAPDVETKLLQARGIKEIKAVKPNALAYKRINEHRKKLGKKPIDDSQIAVAAAAPGSETLTTDPVAADAQILQAVAASSPWAVDNSGLPANPPITDQGPIGSCAGHSGARAFTHNNGVVHGLDNRTSSKFVCSPSYVYDIAKFSKDCSSGTAMAMVMDVFVASGCVNVEAYPISTSSCAGMAKAPAAYRDALTYALDSYQSLLVNPNVTFPTLEEKYANFLSNLAATKALLMNGHVIQFSVNISNTFTASMSPTPSGTNSAALVKSDGVAPSLFEGQLGIGFNPAEGASFGHAMTIVGFDDHAWIDANHNNVIDFGEVGGFKVANSWGTRFANQGYAIVSYYYIFNRSGAYFYYPKPRATPYQPKLLAQINFNSVAGHTQRFDVGLSDLLASTPAEYLNRNSATYVSKPLIPTAWRPADVTASNVGVIVDLTRFATRATAPEKYYALLVDLVGGSPSAITDFFLIDPATNKIRRTPQALPLPVDAESGMVSVEVAGEWIDNNAVVVNPAPVNVAPVVSAGADKALAYTATSVALVGTASDSDGTIAQVAWSQVSGPSAAVLSSPASLSNTVSALKAGTYVFRLTVKDNASASASDDVSVSVAAPPANLAPVVSAGADKAITLPANSVSLAGSASDPEGALMSVSWTQVSGPSMAVLAGQSTTTLSASNLIAGSYTFRLNARDAAGLTAFDDVIVTVKKATRGKR